jgi:hypothetical protein
LVGGKQVSIRLVTLTVTLTTLILAGCGSSPPTHKPAATKPSSSASTESGSTKSGQRPESRSGPLTPDECVEVTEAHLDLLVASNAEQASPPADKLKAYDPPPSVVEAIDHFVEVGGIHFDDPDANTHTDEIKAWVNEVCP